MTSRPSKTIFGRLLTFMMLSTFINKSLMVYFGVNYSRRPGQGYGYGLAITVVVTLIFSGFLIYKYRNTED